MDPSTWWGLLATLFATFPWLLLMGAAGVIALAFNSYLRRGRQIRRSRATLFG
jgi:hypothetical protein